MSSLEPFTLWPRLGLHSAQLRLGAGWCISICSLDQIFQYHCFALIASSFCYYTSRSQFCVSNGSVLFLLLYFQTTVLCFKWQMMYIGMQASLSTTQEPSWAQCTSSVLGRPSISTQYLVLSLEIFARAKSPISYIVNRIACWLVPDSWSKGCEFESPQEWWENFLLQSQLCVLTLIQCPSYPRVTAVARKRPWSFCQNCRWQVIPKHAYTFDSMKSEWADYAAVQAQCGNLVRERAHTALIREHSVTTISARWATVDWSWPRVE